MDNFSASGIKVILSISFINALEEIILFCGFFELDTFEFEIDMSDNADVLIEQDGVDDGVSGGVKDGVDDGVEIGVCEGVRRD